jgi:organic radical activating enzyme
MRRYQVKEIFGPTLQGEGMHAGMPCLFVRLAGCNAWDGRVESRGSSACPYCDTNFSGGEPWVLEDIIARLEALRPLGMALTTLGCVLTGGEPLLQADARMLAVLGEHFSWVDVETNGTRHCPAHPANVFVSCSPKRIADHAVVVEADWWKVLVPDQEEFLAMALASGKPVFVQPTAPDGGVEGSTYAANLRRAVELCLTRGCRLSLQMHKYLGLP